MSTRFTHKGIPMAESTTLRLSQKAANLNHTIVQYVSVNLLKTGYDSITPSLLSFLSTLECGVNYGSEIARSLGVSRQMVAKTVKELCLLGYLAQLDSTGKQKEIVFTEKGERLISEARRILFELDKIFSDKISLTEVSWLTEQLTEIESLVHECIEGVKDS